MVAQRSGPLRARLPQLPALDGIRAVAVVAVLLYHGDVLWTPGGFLGVEVFFVLSGFLITALLCSELDRTGRVSLRDFWLRRARRLLPAVFVLLIAVTAVFLIGWPDDIARARGEVPAAAGYVSNWYLIGSEQSYFEGFMRPSPFGHLWSLAIEEQFYILWPALLLGLTVWLRRPSRVAGAIGGFAVLSAASMWLLYQGGDPSRVYFGTDTRAAGLLLGAALAVIWRPYRRSSWSLWLPPVALDAAVVLSGGMLVWAFLRFDEFEAFTFRPGIQMVAIATAVLIGAVVHPNCRLVRLLDVAPVRALGRRSYSIYLWHWPVFVLTRPEVDLNVGVGPALALRLALTLGLAELSYRYVEQPFRTGAFGRVLAQVRAAAGGPADWRRRMVLGWTGVGVVTLLGMGSLFGALVAVPRPASAVPPDIAEPILPEAPIQRPAALPSGPPAWPSPWASPDEPSPTPSPEVSPAPRRIFAVGDSVMLSGRAALRDRIDRIAVDAAVSRQIHDGIEALRARARTDRLGSVIVIHLGNNGRLTDAHVDEIMRVARPTDKVVFVNVKVPRRWESATNKALAAGVKRHDRAVLVDWHRRWRDCPGKVFASDGTHLTSRGAACYARMIAAAI